MSNVEVTLWYIALCSTITNFIVLYSHVRRWNKEHKEQEDSACIHGHEDWDDCPVCGH